jgi:hypothetical protein
MSTFCVLLKSTSVNPMFNIVGFCVAEHRSDRVMETFGTWLRDGANAQHKASQKQKHSKNWARSIHFSILSHYPSYTG